MKVPNWLSYLVFHLGLGGFAIEMKNQHVLEVRDIGYGDITLLRRDIETWLNDQCPKRWKLRRGIGILPEGFFHVKRSSCVLMFQRDEDRTLFKLIWAGR